jgi:2'-5' RNA ligase
MPEQFSLTGFDAAPKPTDRLFFAIFPDAAAAGRIAQLAHHLRGRHGLKGRPLETGRLHITLHHLGDYPELRQDIVAAAIKAAATVVAAPFEVALDRVLSFSTRQGNRPFVLRGSDGVVALTAFQRDLCAALDRVGLGGGRARAQYTPHVTLLYDDVLVAERPVETLAWTVHEFVLVHSLLGQTVHVPLGQWPLSA